MAGTLSATQYVTLEDLRKIETPKPQGPRHLPVGHASIVDNVVAGLTARGYEVSSMKLGLDRGVTRMFGTIDFGPRGALVMPEGVTVPESGLSLGIRHANDRSLPLAMIAGRKVFVCSNMCFSGDMTIMSKRHTLNLNVEREVGEGLDRAFEKFSSLDDFIDGLKDRKLDDRTARDVIYRAIIERKVVAPQYLPNVHANYFAPEDGWTDCQPRSAWGLYNAVTRVLRDRPMHMTQNGTVALTGYMKAEFKLN